MLYLVHLDAKNKKCPPPQLVCQATHIGHQTSRWHVDYKYSTYFFLYYLLMQNIWHDTKKQYIFCCNYNIYKMHFQHVLVSWTKYTWTKISNTFQLQTPFRSSTTLCPCMFLILQFITNSFMYKSASATHHLLNNSIFSVHFPYKTH